MLVLRIEQLRAFEDAQERRFVRQLAEYLRPIIDDGLKNPDERFLFETARFCCNSAKCYGIEIEDDVRRFAEFFIKYGWGVGDDQRYPWIRGVLSREGISGTEKMNSLDDLEMQFIGIDS